MNAFLAAGPKPVFTRGQPTYPPGVHFFLKVPGVDLKNGAVVTFSPGLDITSNARYTCRSSQKQVMKTFTGTALNDGNDAFFPDVYVPFNLPQGIVCWCPESPCESPDDFKVQLGSFSVTGMCIKWLRLNVNGYH